MKLYNTGKGVGDQLHVPTVKKRDYDGKVKEYVHVPPSFSGVSCQWIADHELPCKCGPDNLIEHEAGNVYLPLFGHSFFVVPKGKYLDVPVGVSVKALRNLAPHLVTEDEHEHGAQSAAELVPDLRPTPEPKKKNN